MLDKIFSSGKDGSEPKQVSATVRIVGDRSSGKTTYMAALARWPSADPKTSPVQMVIPVNEEGEELIAKAKNLLEQGDRFEPTPLVTDVNEVKDYSIRILLKNMFSLLALNVSCKDYAGEFFSDLLGKKSNPVLQDYLDDCLKASGLMLLVDGTSYRQDKDYASGLEKLLMELDRAGNNDTGHRRIALVLTKCEQPELWINRYQPAQTVSNRFPKLKQKLEVWQSTSQGQVDYFAASAFGMLGNMYPGPNMKRIQFDRYGIKDSVLKNPGCWKPFGLVAPIYWLCTGQRHKKLDRE